MPVKVADVVGGLAIAVPPEIVLHRRFGRSVRLGLHDAFIAHDRWLLVLLSAETDEVREFLEEAHGKGSPWSRRRRGNKAVDRGQGDRGDNKRQDPHHRGHLLLLNGISFVSEEREEYKNAGRAQVGGGQKNQVMVGEAS